MEHSRPTDSEMSWKRDSTAKNRKNLEAEAWKPTKKYLRGGNQTTG